MERYDADLRSGARAQHRVIVQQAVEMIEGFTLFLIAGELIDLLGKKQAVRKPGNTTFTHSRIRSPVAGGEVETVARRRAWRKT